MTEKKSVAGIRLGEAKSAIALTSPNHAHRTEFPHRALGNGAPPTTIENLWFLIVLARIVVRYNVIKKKTEILIPEVEGSTDNYDNNAVTHVCSMAAEHGMATGQIPAILETIADRNPYNPVLNWIDSAQWDGVDRLPEICATLVAVEDYPPELKVVLIVKWLLSAVAAARKPHGFHSRGVLTLQGKQGLGKTAWGRSLISDGRIRDLVLKLDHHLDGNNKDSILGAITHWIVEIGELDSSFKRDIARLKGFLTNDKDKIRRPYARVEAEYGRRTVFFATVNQADFLVDSTGNSRWWTIPVVEIDYKHNVDMQQVFAQLSVRFEAGDNWWLTPEEEALLEKWNARHRSYNMIADVLSLVIDWDLADPACFEKLTITELLGRAGLDKPTNPQFKECAAYLREHKVEPKRIRGYERWPVPIRSQHRSGGEASDRPNSAKVFD